MGNVTLTFDSGYISWREYTSLGSITSNGISLIKMSNTSTMSILHTKLGSAELLGFYTGSTICQGTLQAGGIYNSGSITLQVYAM